VEYAHRHLDEVGVTWQFAAEDRSVLAAGFGELAAQLGVLGPADNRDPVASVHGALASYRAGWLLVFDNAPDRAAVAAFVPPAGRGLVLITSRNPTWPPGPVLDVPVLDTGVAAQFLLDRTSDLDHQSALGLAGELGGLPLALEQAGAYIQATGNTLATYLASFQRRRPEMLARGEPAGYPKTVATTWSLAFSELEQSAPQAAGLLRLLAFCAPEAIPLSLLLQPWPGLADQLGEAVVPLLEDQLAAGDAVAALGRYSLVSVVGSGLASVHRLVQVVTVDQMPAELRAAWQEAAAAVIESALPDDPEQPAAWPLYGQLLPHAQAALAAGSEGLSLIADYLGHSGSPSAARDLWQNVVAARSQVSGAEHPGIWDARAALAYWIGRAGDAAGARDQLAAVLPLQERALGAEHPDPLATRHNLARFTGEAGDAAGARDQYTALLPIRERVLGAEHPNTLTDRANLAFWTGEAGDPAGARDQFAALVPIRERVSGPEHPETLAFRANLAYWTGEAGDAARARDQCAALLPIRERVLGPDHPHTLQTRHNLARFTGEAGDAAGARDQMAAVLLIEERVHGPEHPDTLATRYNLASWTGKAGDAAGARDQLAALLPISKRVLGPRHPVTRATRNNLHWWTMRAETGGD
jgi:hypothetical protein